MNEAVEKGLEYWYQRQKQYLTEFWRRSDLDIDGDEETAMAVRYNLYQLLQSAGRDRFSVILLLRGCPERGTKAITSGIPRCICGHFYSDKPGYLQKASVISIQNA